MYDFSSIYMLMNRNRFYVYKIVVKVKMYDFSSEFNVVMVSLLDQMLSDDCDIRIVFGVKIGVKLSII